MILEFPWLSLVIWLPIIGGIAVIASGDQNAELTKRIALAVRALDLLGEPAAVVWLRCLDCGDAVR